MNNISKVSEITYQDIADYGRFGMRNGNIQEEMPAFAVVDRHFDCGLRLTYTLSL